MSFFILLVLLALAYFLYNISESLIDIRDELRAANRNQELALQSGQASENPAQDVSDT